MNCSIYNHTGHRMQLMSVSQMICECRMQLSESASLGEATIFKTEIQFYTLNNWSQSPWIPTEAGTPGIPGPRNPHCKAQGSRWPTGLGL